MGEKYSKEDHDKCKKVAEVFQKLYDMLGDTCVLDAGEFGFVYLTHYREQKSCFDRNKYIVMQKNCLKHCGMSGFTVK